MSESIDVNSAEVDIDDDKTDFMKITGDIFGGINFKLACFVFILGIIIFSDVFIDGILLKIDGTVNGECTTTKGTIIQLLLLSLGLIMLDLAIKRGWL
jgi:hypothetical protein